MASRLSLRVKRRDQILRSSHAPRRGSIFSLFAFALCASLLSSSCGSKTGLVTRGPHLVDKEEAPHKVLHRPPPAEIEVMPLRRNKNCFYLDGYHEPKGSAWSWVHGSWILPPVDCYYAPPQTLYEDLDVGTTLVHRKGVWHPLPSNVAQSCGDPLECPDANATTDNSSPGDQ